MSDPRFAMAVDIRAGRAMLDESDDPSRERVRAGRDAAAIPADELL